MDLDFIDTGPSKSMAFYKPLFKIGYLILEDRFKINRFLGGHHKTSEVYEVIKVNDGSKYAARIELQGKMI